MTKVLKILPVLFLVFLFLVQADHDGYSASGNYYDTLQTAADSLTVQDSLLVIQQNLAEGKKLYEKKCQRCHELHSPKDYRLKQWKENLDEMKEKAELTKNEYKLILGYLSANCKK